MCGTLKVYALFGDFGMHGGKKVSGIKHSLYFSKYKFEDYFSLDSFEKGKLIVDKHKVRKILQEMQDFPVVYVGDSGEALLLWYVMRKLQFPQKIFLINDVDLFKRAIEIHALIYKHYRERVFDEFLTSKSNNWMYISKYRKSAYLKLGISPSHLYYIPAVSSTLSFFFPDLWKEMRRRPAKCSSDGLKGKILSVGSHNRDYETLVSAVRGTRLCIHIICNLRAYKPIHAHNVFWHDSLPESEYVHAIRNARFIIIPLKESERASGQMNCSISMYFGKIVVASKMDALHDLINDKRTGFFYKAGSVEDLKSVLCYVENKFDKIQNVGKDSRHAEKKLSALARKSLEMFLTKASDDVL